MNYTVNLKVIGKPFLTTLSLGFILLFTSSVFDVSAQAQPGRSAIIDDIVMEANENSQLQRLAFELLDVIGPRLVGSPQMDRAHAWAIETFNGWGISARNERFGEWRGWERGISYIDMVDPWVRTLAGTQLAWSPSTGAKPIEGEVVVLPQVADVSAFESWLKTIKGKHVLASIPQRTGRPDYNWEEFGTEASIQKMKTQRAAETRSWNENMRRMNVTANTLPGILERAGAAGIVSSNWSNEFGGIRIFGARTTQVPSVDLHLEDYNLLYRLAENGNKPKIRITTDSKDLGNVPMFNTIAEIKGVERPNEYIILSAHLDSWDGGTGAVDNGTGVIAMMEVARILKKLVPNPKRTILIGLWGSEEQGLNGSRAFVLDNPEITKNTQVVFNLDNGTGRVKSINGSGFVHAYDFLGRWLDAVPSEISSEIQTTFPGSPGGGASDHVPFIAAGIPAFMLSAHPWGYRNITWHTNLDTHDKLVFDDLQHNVILTAILTYYASEEPELVSREKRVLPLGRDGNPGSWPAVREPRRSSVGY